MAPFLFYCILCYNKNNKSMDNLIVRKGKPEDADPANKLIYSTGDYFFDYIFSHEKDKIFDLLVYLFKQHYGIFSHKFSTIAEDFNKVVGIELGYGKSEKRIHALINGIYTANKIGLMRVPRALVRDYIYHRFFKTLDSKSYYIAHLAVLPDYQGKGIGTKLLENAFKKAKQKKFLTCSLDVSIDNEEAFRLYEESGFKIKNKIHMPRLESKYNLKGQYRMVKFFR